MSFSTLQTANVGNIDEGATITTTSAKIPCFAAKARRCFDSFETFACAAVYSMHGEARENNEYNMKTFILQTLAIGTLCTALSANLTAANAENGIVDFGKFSPASGAEFVEVNVNSNLITMALNLAKQSEPDIVEVLKGLKGVRVNVMGLTDENRKEVQDRVTSIRKELDTKGWERIVTAMEKHNDVGVYMKTRGSEAVEGIVVTVLEGNKHAVLVNVVGDIRPEKLATIGERFDIEPLKKLKVKSAKHDDQN